MRLADHRKNVVLVALFGASLPLFAQIASSPLPNTQPTHATQATVPAATPPANSVSPRPGAATVLWEKGLLRVDARNSSLNAILRDISLRTGMKIVGGVQEERVFGTYGPASAAAVLQQLLDGSKTNMLLQSDSAMLPVVLTLTPQIGRPTPPNPMAARDDRSDEDRLFSPDAPPAPPPDLRSRDFRPQGAPPDQPAADRGTGTDDQTTNGARTPQQIMEQLQKLRAQQQNQ
jgi:hypothetical protein